MQNKNQEVANIVREAFNEIDERIIKNLNKGGDGCTQRIINGAENNIADILDETPMEIDGVLYG